MPSSFEDVFLRCFSRNTDPAVVRRLENAWETWCDQNLSKVGAPTPVKSSVGRGSPSLPAGSAPVDMGSVTMAQLDLADPVLDFDEASVFECIDNGNVGMITGSELQSNEL